MNTKKCNRLTPIEKIAYDIGNSFNRCDHKKDTNIVPTDIHSRYLLSTWDLINYARSDLGRNYQEKHGSLLPAFPCAVSNIDGSGMKGTIITTGQILLVLKAFDPLQKADYMLCTIADYDWKPDIDKFQFSVLAALAKFKCDTQWQTRENKYFPDEFRESCKRSMEEAISVFLYFLGNYIHCYLGTEIHEVNHKQRVIRQISKSSDEIEKPLPNVIYRVIDRVKHIYPGHGSNGGTTTRPRHRVHVDSHKRRLKEDWIGHDLDGNVCLGETQVHEHWRYMDNPEIPIVTIKKPLKISPT